MACHLKDVSSGFYVLRIGQEESGGIRVRKAAGWSIVFKTPSDGRHFQPPLQRTNCNVLHASFCLQNAGLVLKHQSPCLQAVTVLSGAY